MKLFMGMFYTLELETNVYHVEASERRNGLQEYQDVKETLGKRNHDASHTAANNRRDSMRMKGVQKFPDVAKKDETRKEINQRTSTREESKSPVKEITRSESGELY